MNKMLNKWTRLPIETKVSISYAICSILQRCLSFITLPLFSRLLTKEQYGQYTVYTSWVGILAIFITLNLAYGSFSKAMIKYEHDRDGYIASIQGICLLLATIFLIIYVPFAHLWNILFELPTIMIVLMIFELLGTTAIQFWSGKKRFEFKYKSVIAVTLIMSIISPICAYFLVINTNEKGFARIIGYAGVTILFGMFFFCYNAIKGKKIFIKEYWKYAFSFNLPLVIYYLSQTIFNQSDRIMISHMEGTDKAAVYGVAYTLATILTFVLNAINNSYVPWLYNKIKNGKGNENKSISLLLSLGIGLLLLGIIWFAPEIIYVMAGEQYLESVGVVPPVAISVLMLFFSQLFINIEFYYEEKKCLIRASIGAAVFNIISNYYLIKLFGYYAAAYTTLISYIIFAVANCMYMRKVMKTHHVNDELYNYKGMIIVFCFICVLSVVGVMLYNYFYIRIFWVGVVFIVLMLKREKVFELYNRFRK